MITQFIPDIFGSVVASVSTVLNARATDPFKVYYDFGHYAEVVKNLGEKDRSVSNKERYPLVWLVMDFEEKMFEGGNYAVVDAHILIAMDTVSTYTMQQRRDNVFLKRLYPIYAELIEQLTRSKALRMDNQPAHTKIDRPYWGGQESGDGKANIFNDYIDAIQIKGLKLNIKKQICLTQ